MSHSVPEILAPAGNAESLQAAVYNGADAVYLGLNNFSARAKAANFSLEQLSDAVEFAHLFGVKIYVAVNTLIKDAEMKAALESVEAAKRLKVDAFIIQDLGLLTEIKRIMPDIILHASTQMGIHNLYGAETAKKLGFKRIILSRETTLTDIIKIRDNVDIETEVFVQGALCVAFSGNCLLSSLVSGYSGNRGKCLQLCRKKYETIINGEKKDGYYLSAKDLCLLSHLKELSEAGVASFKIEGRMRRPEYVGESVAVYKKAVNALREKRGIDITAETDRLKRVFNRGDYCGGYLKQPTADVIYPLLQGHKGLKLGKVCKLNNRAVTLDSGKTVNTGDGLKYLRNGRETGSSLVSDPNRITFQGDVREGDEAYLTTDAFVMSEISKRTSYKKIHYKIELKEGRPAAALLRLNDTEVYCLGDTIVTAAENKALEKEDVVRIFSQTGRPYIKTEDVEVLLSGDIFLPLGSLKRLRRQCLDTALKILNDNYKVEKDDSVSYTLSDIIRQNFGFNLNRLLKFDQPEVVKHINRLESMDAFIYSPEDYSDYETIKKVFEECNKPVFLDTPLMARDKDLEVLRNLADAPFVKHVVADNLYAIALFKGKNVLPGSMMNLLNDSLRCEKIVSLETDKPPAGTIVTVFSRPPLMTLAHCPYKTVKGECGRSCKGFSGTMKDERGNKFLLRHYKVHHCYARLTADKPVCIEEEFKKMGFSKCLYDISGYDYEQAVYLLNGIQRRKVETEHIHFNYNKKLQ